MPYAKHLQLATIDFMIGNPDPLPRETALLAMAAAMTADGHRDETANVLRYVVKEHPDPEHVREVIIQSHLFCGFPRTLNGLEALDMAMEREGVARSKLRTDPIEQEMTIEQLDARGRDLWNRIYGANDDRVANRAKSLSPDLSWWGLIHGYGRVMSRPGPDALAREFCVVAALIPMDVQPQLKGHVSGVLNLGGTPDQLWKLVGVLRSLFDAQRLFDITTRTFESVIGKKDSGMSFEEEMRHRWD